MNTARRLQQRRVNKAMDVNYSDNVTGTIRTLRESVYNTDEFKSEFSSNLKSSISATDATFIPEQFGGWSVNVNMNDVNIQDYKSYLAKIADALTSSIHTVNKSVDYKNISSSSLTNVVVTGSNSLAIKL